MDVVLPVEIENVVNVQEHSESGALARYSDAVRTAVFLLAIRILLLYLLLS